MKHSYWRIIRELIRRVKSVSKESDRIDVHLDALLMDLLEFEAALSSGSFVNPNRPAPGQGPGTGSIPFPPPHAVEGFPVVSRMSCHKQLDGAWKFDLDGRSLVLRGRCAELLLLLAGNESKATDELVGWKECELLRASLGNGSLLSAGALDNLVYRLRRAIEKQTGLPRSVILRHASLGVRLALRRPSSSEDILPTPPEDESGA